MMKKFQSPYVVFGNSPTIFNDLLGADKSSPLDDYHIYEDGRVEVLRTGSHKNNYYFHTNKGDEYLVGTFEVKNYNGVDLVNLGVENTYYNKVTTNSKNYLLEDAAAGFLGAVFAGSVVESMVL